MPIFKSLAPYKAEFISAVKSVPQQFTGVLQNIQTEFIWDRSRPKIKHSILIGYYYEGDYKNVDIASKLLALKIFWIRKLLDDDYHPLLP